MDVGASGGGAEKLARNTLRNRLRKKNPGKISGQIYVGAFLL